MQFTALVAVLFLAIAVQADPNSCGQWPTCAECLQHNLCGWCAVNVVYEDGTIGPHCAGKPQDPNHPPPGFKKWTCPKDYQNRVCFGYVCDPLTYQCVSSGAPGKGVPLAECEQNCFPPTYLCNTTTYKCDLTTPGHGSDKRSCEASCRNDLYVCTDDAKCVPSQGGGGVPKAACETSCKPSNNTPADLLGVYRGLEVSKGYIKGEWTAQITPSTAFINKPDGSTYAKGQILTFRQQLWIKTPIGIRKGIYSEINTPEVQVLTWALGAVGGGVPVNFDVAMMNNEVFVLYKCLNAQVCRFSAAEALDLISSQIPLLKRDQHEQNEQQQNSFDPCMPYPDCQSCVNAPYYCGWCSIPVVYNGTIPGKQCAGVNKTITHATFNCTGSFSIESCAAPTTTSTSTTTTTTTTTTTSSTSSSSSSSSTTGSIDKYTCDPVTLTCKRTKDGQPLQVCQAQCKSVPVVPIQLQDKFFRGLQINQNYIKGEWDANFTKTDVTVWDPKGKVLKGSVSMVASYLVVHWNNGVTTSSLWQYQAGQVTDFLSWAWSAPNGAPPTSFDNAMTTPGMTEYQFVACPSGKSTSICRFP